MTEPTPRAGRLWRALVPIAGVAAGLLLTTTAVTARGTDLRSSRTLQVSQLIQRQQATVADLTHEAATLRSRISAATALAAVGDRRVREVQRRSAALEAAAGLTSVRGPAVTVRLDDVPRREQQADLDAGAQPDDLVIHQQDVQGVVNALWAGGAEAMTVMGLRVVSTSAVRCVGNTLLLHGRVFSPPFVITAVGDVSRLRRSLDADPLVQVFRQYVVAYGLRYHVTTTDDVTIAPYSGPLSLRHARVRE